MKKIFLLILVSLFLFSSCSERELENKNNMVNEEISKEGKKPQDFTIETNYNTKFTLYENNGKPTLINFFATWCGPCVEEMPAFEMLKEEYGDQINLIVVDCAEDRSIVDKFIQDNNYTFQVGYDNGDISEAYGITGIPFTLVLNKNNEILKTFTGSRGVEAQYNAYKEQIEIALNEN